MSVSNGCVAECRFVDGVLEIIPRAGVSNRRIEKLFFESINPRIPAQETQVGEPTEGSQSPPIMIDSSGSARMIDSLRDLLERLGSPDLTLVEAKVLRSQVFHLLEETGHDTHDSRQSSRSP
jgi:hypothetical protein